MKYPGFCEDSLSLGVIRRNQDLSEGTEISFDCFVSGELPIHSSWLVRGLPTRVLFALYPYEMRTI